MCWGVSALNLDSATEAVATALLGKMREQEAEALRKRFLEHFTLETHLSNLASALRSVETPEVSQAQVPTPAQASCR